MSHLGKKITLHDLLAQDDAASKKEVSP